MRYFATTLFSLVCLTSSALAQQTELNGSVIDTSGAAIARAHVKLALNGRAPDQETESATQGDFAFHNVPTGPYILTVSATGFSPKTLTGDLAGGEPVHLPPVTLAIDALSTAVNVTQTQTEIAQAELKELTQQRLLGVVPNFFTAYDHDAAPLNLTQKLELSGRAWADPSSFVIGGIIAGVWQAQNVHRGFGQGAQGYAKRYGASFADYGTMLLLDKVVAPSVFHQDPRYFAKGTGSKTSRALYAASRTVVCRGDNKKDQFCYSSLLSRFGTGFVTNYYYPAADRDKSGVILRSSAIGLGFEVVGNLFQEFLSRKLTRKRR